MISRLIGPTRAPCFFSEGSFVIDLAAIFLEFCQSSESLGLIEIFLLETGFLSLSASRARESISRNKSDRYCPTVSTTEIAISA